jgi:hypothetical protein
MEESEKCYSPLPHGTRDCYYMRNNITISLHFHLGSFIFISFHFQLHKFDSGRDVA